MEFWLKLAVLLINSLKGPSPLCAPMLRSKPDTDRKRHLTFYCTLQHVSNRQHDVIFLKNLRFVVEEDKNPADIFWPA